MAKLSIRPGSTSVSVDIFIQDSSVTTGAGLTGLVFNSGSLTAYYKRNGNTAPVAITLATLAAVTTAWSSGGFIACDGTNTPGLYRLDIPDAALATGVRGVVIHLKGATNMVPCVLEIDLSNEANVWAWHSSDLLTGVGAFRRLGIIDSGTAQAATSTTLQRRAAATLADSEVVGAVDTIYSATAGSGQSRVVTANVGSTDTDTVDAWTTTPTGTIVYDTYASPPASATSLPGVNVLKVNGTNQTARDIGASVLLSPGTGTGQISLTTGSVTVGTNSDKTGYTVSTVSDKTGYSLSATQAFNNTGNLTGNVIGNVTGSTGSVTAGVTVSTNNDKTGMSLSNAGIDALFTRQLTESYATDGQAPTVAQALMLTQQLLGDFAISGTTLTVKRVDGLTAAATFTLDSTTPTGITRAT